MQTEYTPLTRKELQEAHMIVIQKKKKAHLDGLAYWVNRNVYDPVKKAAMEGHTSFQWKMNDHDKSKDDWEYIMQKINSLVPDCDLHTSSFEEQTILRNPPVCTIRWG